MLYGAGLHRFGLDPGRVLLFAAPSEKALLWAAEQAASCPAWGGAIIVLGQREKLYGFTVSRRLKLRQQRSGVPLFLVRTMAVSRPPQPRGGVSRSRRAKVWSRLAHRPGGAA